VKDPESAIRPDLLQKIQQLYASIFDVQFGVEHVCLFASMGAALSDCSRETLKTDLC
jgi:hypothetical protein